MALKHKTHEVERAAVVQRASNQPVQTENEHKQLSTSRSTLERIVTKPSVTLRPADILTLQRTVGNRVVQRMLSNEPYALSGLPSTSAPTIQRQTEEEEPLQRKSEPSVRAENKTGLPDRLKAGIENLSGLSLDDVRVHRNSPKPAETRALAYTQGADIHLGPDQEKHLSHEAWHVVQQKQGRVRPTIQAKGLSVNDDAELEREADVMGARAMADRLKPSAPVSRGQAISNSSIEFTQAQIQMKRSYSLLANKFVGNNDVQVKKVNENDDYHLSIVDKPPPKREFTEFHVTFENNNEDRRPHFYYDELAKYDTSHEVDNQNLNYKADVAKDEKADVKAKKNLAAFDTLKGTAQGHATGFITELNAAEEKEKQRKIEEQEQKAAETAAKQGINGFQLVSKLKPQPEAKAAWNAPVVAYSQQEAQTYKTRVASQMPQGTKFKYGTKESGKYMMVDIKLPDYKTQGAKAYKAVLADGSTAQVKKIKWPDNSVWP